MAASQNRRQHPESRGTAYDDRKIRRSLCDHSARLFFGAQALERRAQRPKLTGHRINPFDTEMHAVPKIGALQVDLDAAAVGEGAASVVNLLANFLDTVNLRRHDADDDGFDIWRDRAEDRAIGRSDPAFLQEKVVDATLDYNRASVLKKAGRSGVDGDLGNLLRGGPTDCLVDNRPPQIGFGERLHDAVTKYDVRAARSPDQTKYQAQESRLIHPPLDRSVSHLVDMPCDDESGTIEIGCLEAQGALPEMLAKLDGVVFDPLGVMPRASEQRRRRCSTPERPKWRIRLDCARRPQWGRT